jgi:iron complex outermembrane receptor protein
MSNSRLICLCLLVLSVAPAQTRRDTIVVTGVYEPIAIEEADRPVRTLDVEKQRLLSNAAVDLLQLDPSVDLRQRAPGGVQSDLSIRGGTFGQTLVLLDGLRLNDAQTGHYNMDLPVPMESISSIEVLRGSGSTLYGSDAVGGVVNFVTRSPEATQFRLRTAAGNFGVNQQRFSLAVVRGRIAQQFAASRDFSSGFMPNRDYRNLSLVSNSHFSTGLGSTSVLLAHNDRPYGADNFYGNYHSWERTKTWFASLRQGLGERTEAAFAFRRHTDLFVLHRDRPEVFTNRHAVEGYQGALRRRENIGRNTRLHYGVEGLHNSIASNNLGYHSRSSGAVYAAVDFRALGRFSLSAGVREQVYGAKRSEISPTIGAGVWLNGRVKLKGSVSRAFRLPSYTDLYYHDPASLGSPDLRPESAWNYDTGLDWHAGGRLRGDFTMFHRRESDGIDYVRRSESDIWRATNIQRLRFSGVETSMAVRLAQSHQIELRYTALKGSRAALDGLLSRYVFNYPCQAGVVTWQASMPGSLVGRVRVGSAQRLGRDAYTVIDAYLARTGRRIRPFLQLTNLTNARYEEIPRVPMPGRGIVGGIELVAFGPFN